jgi:hypothetical protein
MSAIVPRSPTHRIPLVERLLHNVLATEHQAVKRIVSQRLRTGSRVNVNDQLAIKHRVGQGIIQAFPVGKVKVVQGKVALLAVDLVS